MTSLASIVTTATTALVSPRPLGTATGVGSAAGAGQSLAAGVKPSAVPPSAQPQQPSSAPATAFEALGAVPRGSAAATSPLAQLSVSQAPLGGSATSALALLAAQTAAIDGSVTVAQVPANQADPQALINFVNDEVPAAVPVFPGETASQTTTDGQWALTAAEPPVTKAGVAQAVAVISQPASTNGAVAAPVDGTVVATGEDDLQAYQEAVAAAAPVSSSPSLQPEAGQPAAPSVDEGTPLPTTANDPAISAEPAPFGLTEPKRTKAATITDPYENLATGNPLDPSGPHQPAQPATDGVTGGLDGLEPAPVDQSDIEVTTVSTASGPGLGTQVTAAEAVNQSTGERPRPEPRSADAEGQRTDTSRGDTAAGEKATGLTKALQSVSGYQPNQGSDTSTASQPGQTAIDRLNQLIEQGLGQGAKTPQSGSTLSTKGLADAPVEKLDPSGTPQPGLATETVRAPGQAAASAAPRPQPTPVFQNVPVNDLGLTISKAAQDGQSSFSIRLTPADLGRIDIKLDFQSDGTLRAMIAADSRETLNLLRGDAASLERALTEAGIKTENGGLNFSLNQQGDNAAQGQNANARPDNGTFGELVDGEAAGTAPGDDTGLDAVLPQNVLNELSIASALRNGGGLDIKI